MVSGLRPSTSRFSQVCAGSFEASGANYRRLAAARFFAAHTASTPALLRQWQLAGEVARHACTPVAASGFNPAAPIDATDLDEVLTRLLPKTLELRNCHLR